MAMNIQRIAVAEVKDLGFPLSSRSFDQKELFRIIPQLAIQVLFVLGATFMVASPPLAGYMSIVVLTFGASALSVLFFPLKEPSRPAIDSLNLFSLKSDFSHPLQIARSSPIPADAPRGITRKPGSMNCAFNAATHFLESDPAIANWLRHPISEESSLAGFETQLASYNPPPGLLTAFRGYVEKENVSPSQFLKVLGHFMETFNPVVEEKSSFEDFQKAYFNLTTILPAFRDFLALYDQAVREGKPVTEGDSQTLRLALSRAGVVSPSEQVPEPIAAILDRILNYGPKFLKAHYEDLIKLAPTELAPVPARPYHPTARESLLPILPVHLDLDRGTDPHFDLRSLFLNHYEKFTTFRYEQLLGMDGKIHSYGVCYGGLRFLEAPAALRFFLGQSPIVESNYSEPQQLNDPIQIPRVFSISVNGVVHNYRLVATINHLGSPFSIGHFVAIRIINDRVYLINDSKVTQLGPEEAEQTISQASYVLYIHI